MLFDMLTSVIFKDPGYCRRKSEGSTSWYNWCHIHPIVIYRECLWHRY